MYCRYCGNPIPDGNRFCAKEDKRMRYGTDHICIVSPDGAIGLTGTEVEDPDDPGSIDWVYVTKARALGFHLSVLYSIV